MCHILTYTQVKITACHPQTRDHLAILQVMQREEHKLAGEELQPLLPSMPRGTTDREKQLWAWGWEHRCHRDTSEEERRHQLQEMWMWRIAGQPVGGSDDR